MELATLAREATPILPSRRPLSHALTTAKVGPGLFVCDTDQSDLLEKLMAVSKKFVANSGSSRES
jgi:hypothetical protein